MPYQKCFCLGQCRTWANYNTEKHLVLFNLHLLLQITKKKKPVIWLKKKYSLDMSINPKPYQKGLLFSNSPQSGSVYKVEKPINMGFQAKTLQGGHGVTPPENYIMTAPFTKAAFQRSKTPQLSFMEMHRNEVPEMLGKLNRFDVSQTMVCDPLEVVDQVWQGLVVGETCEHEYHPFSIPARSELQVTSRLSQRTLLYGFYILLQWRVTTDTVHHQNFTLPTQPGVRNSSSSLMTPL